MRVIEESLEQRRNEMAGEKGDPRENPPTNTIDSHMRKYRHFIINSTAGVCLALCQCCRLLDLPRRKKSHDVMTRRPLAGGGGGSGQNYVILTNSPNPAMRKFMYVWIVDKPTTLASFRLHFVARRGIFLPPSSYLPEHFCDTPDMIIASQPKLGQLKNLVGRHLVGLNHGGVFPRLLVYHQLSRVTYPAGSFHSFSHGNRAGLSRRAFRFLHYCILALLHTRLASPSSALKTSDVKRVGCSCASKCQEARERYGRKLHASLAPHRSYAQGPKVGRDFIASQALRLLGRKIMQGDMHRGKGGLSSHGLYLGAMATSLSVLRDSLNYEERGKNRQERPISTLASHQGEPGLIPGRVTGFSQVGIVPDDAISRWFFFPGISQFSPSPFITALLHIHFNHPHRLSRLRYQESSKHLHFTSVGRGGDDRFRYPLTSPPGCASGLPRCLGNRLDMPIIRNVESRSRGLCAGGLRVYIRRRVVVSANREQGACSANQTPCARPGVSLSSGYLSVRLGLTEIAAGRPREAADQCLVWPGRPSALAGDATPYPFLPNTSHRRPVFERYCAQWVTGYYRLFTSARCRKHGVTRRQVPVLMRMRAQAVFLVSDLPDLSPHDINNGNKRVDGFLTASSKLKVSVVLWRGGGLGSGVKGKARGGRRVRRPAAHLILTVVGGPGKCYDIVSTVISATSFALTRLPTTPRRTEEVAVLSATAPINLPTPVRYVWVQGRHMEASACRCRAPYAYSGGAHRASEGLGCHGYLLLEYSSNTIRRERGKTLSTGKNSKLLHALV
ncbi:hypothetical protein PR048_029604 [Dryococelus australis]|uniref:Uncharacterized protein n=1 Tax=Dryococelus australis TaxID=614101 RepID=A0ABQ9GFX0_9NEOP|nr:hypothetical protein PR048_029604 [Dryococelus australis]